MLKNETNVSLKNLYHTYTNFIDKAMSCNSHPSLYITFDPLKKESIIETLAYFHTQDLGIMGKNSIEIEKKYNPENTANNIINAITHIYNSKK